MRGALGDPVWPNLPTCVGTRHGDVFAILGVCGSDNSQSALGKYLVLMSAPFLLTVGAIWAVLKDCSDCSTKANYPTPESMGMVSFPVHVSERAVLGLPVHLACSAAVAARLWSFQVTVTVHAMLLTHGTSVGPSIRTRVR